MIALFVILFALVAIISKIIAHIRYVSCSIDSPEILDFVGALPPIFIGVKEEQSDKKLKKLANRIRTYLIMFYSCIIIFFAYTAF